MSNAEFTLKVAGIEQVFTSYADAVECAPLFGDTWEIWQGDVRVDVATPVKASARTRRVGATLAASFFRNLARLAKECGITAEARKDFSGQVAYYHAGSYRGNDVDEVFVWAWNRSDYGTLCLEAALAARNEGHELTDLMARRIA